MRARPGRGDPGFYPERSARPGSALERFAGRLAFGARRAFARALRPPAGLAAGVAAHAARFRAAPLAGQVPALRYRLRRDGLDGEGLAQCFGLYAAAAGQPPPEALAGASALVRGGIVDCADAQARGEALALAAAAFALCGIPVHLYVASEARTREAAARLRAPLGALGLGVAAVTAELSPAERRVAYGAAVACGTHRVIAFDYLRDRMQLGRRLRPLQGRLERISGDTTTGAQMLLLAGLHCALVEDADLVLLDDARVPMVVSADVAASADRLPYEQALELARALRAGAEFELGDGGALLTAAGAGKLAQLAEVLGGLWSARQRCEELVAAALTALHALERGRDYHVTPGGLQLPPPADDEAAPVPEALQRLLEVKEGLPFGGRRGVLARLSLPQYFRRYLRLAGACADARGLEGDFWAAYGLRSARAGSAPAEAPCAARAFAGSAQRRAALVEAVRARAARGEAVVVAVRTGEEAAALAGALQQAGLRPALLRGAAGDEELAALAALARPGAVTLSLHPAQRSFARAGSAGAPVHLVLAELHDARRHVAQILRAYGAASCEQFLALEDEVVARLLPHARARDAELAPAAAARLATAAQAAAERALRDARRDMLAREQSQEELLAFSGRPE